MSDAAPMYTCPQCKGTGMDPNDTRNCGMCGGSGELPYEDPNEPDDSADD